jgi:hypothetical protein
MGTERFGALANKVAHPLIDFSDSEIVGSGDFGRCGVTLDDFHDRGSLAACGPAFDVFGWLVHR